MGISHWCFQSFGDILLGGLWQFVKKGDLTFASPPKYILQGETSSKPETTLALSAISGLCSPDSDTLELRLHFYPALDNCQEPGTRIPLACFCFFRKVSCKVYGMLHWWQFQIPVSMVTAVFSYLAAFFFLNLFTPFCSCECPGKLGELALWWWTLIQINSKNAASRMSYFSVLLVLNKLKRFCQKGGGTWRPHPTYHLNEFTSTLFSPCRFLTFQISVKKKILNGFA